MLVGAVSFSDTVDAAVVAANLVAQTCRSGVLRAETVTANRRLACSVVRNDHGASQFGRVDLGPKEFICVSGNIPWDAARIEELLRTSPRPEAVIRALPGHWSGVRYEAGEDRLEIFTDTLGVGWTFVASLQWGYAFGPDFGALVRALPQAQTPNYEHMLATLGIGYALDESTCFEGIRLVPAGSVLRCQAGRESLSSSEVSYGEPRRDPQDGRMRQYGEVLNRAAEIWIHPVLDELDISLSAGLDCRYGLGLMLEAGRTPKGYTFGHGNSGEVQRAKKIARAAHMTTEVYPVESTGWEGWRRCVEQTGAVGGFHWPDWLGWLEFLRARSRRVLIGFLGDALSGKHLAQASGSSVEANIYAWAGQNVDTAWLQSDLLSTQARRDGAEVVNASIQRLAGSAHYAQGYQVQLHLDWYGRQRRFTGAQPNLMQSYFGVVPFLYEPGMLEFWASAPLDDLRAQHLYKHYAAKRFPGLFAASLQRPTLMQRFAGSARNAIAGLGPRWKARFAAPVLDPVQMLVEQKMNILDTLTRAEQPLSSVLKVDRLREQVRAFPNPQGISAMQLRRVVNIAILLEMAVVSGNATNQAGAAVERHGEPAGH